MLVIIKTNFYKTQKIKMSIMLVFTLCRIKKRIHPTIIITYDGKLHHKILKIK